MTSLVTGGAGFIGSHVAEVLSMSGEKVVVVDDLSGGFRENIKGNEIDFIQGSINDTSLLEILFSKNHFDYVYHLAAYAAEGLSHFIKRFNYENNLIGTINLINAAVNHSVKVFVFSSSIAVYGNKRPPMTESMIPNPQDSYGIAKFAVEQELRITQNIFGLNYIIFRPHNVYGERQNFGDRYRNVIGIFMNQILKDEPLTIFGDGNQTRAFTYISDVAPIIANSVHNHKAFNEAFNIGSDDFCSLNELANKVSIAMGVNPKVVHLQSRHEVKHAYSSHDKIRNLFSIPSATPLENGLFRMSSWVREKGVRISHEFNNIEIYKNLPPSWIK